MEKKEEEVGNNEKGRVCKWEDGEIGGEGRKKDDVIG